MFLEAILGASGGGGSGATVEEGDFTVSSATTPVAIPVQMADYDVLVAYATINYNGQSQQGYFITHYENLMPSNSQTKEYNVFDFWRDINWQGYLAENYNIRVGTAKTIYAGNGYKVYVGTWHYIAIKLAS